MRPLEGLRVVDLTRVLSGPYCTMQLGDLGAEVIKVERPGEGDDTRAFAPPFQGDQAAYFLSVNRNKKSMTLDMKSDRGKEVLWKLIEVSDVLVENFRPGAMDRLGLGYEAVKARRPSMVYCSISGFGDTGIYKDRPGYDVIVQGEAGVMDITGPRDGAPHKVGVAVADLVSGLNASQGILAALYTCKIDRARPACARFPCMRPWPRSSPSTPASILRPAIPRAAAATSILRSSPTRPSRPRTDGSIWASPTTTCGSASARRRNAPNSLVIRDMPRHPTACAIARCWCRSSKSIVKARSRDEWLKRLDKAGVPSGAIRTVGEVCDGAGAEGARHGRRDAAS